MVITRPIVLHCVAAVAEERCGFVLVGFGAFTVSIPLLTTAATAPVSGEVLAGSVGLDVRKCVAGEVFVDGAEEMPVRVCGLLDGWLVFGHG